MNISTFQPESALPFTKPSAILKHYKNFPDRKGQNRGIEMKFAREQIANFLGIVATDNFNVKFCNLDKGDLVRRRNSSEVGIIFVLKGKIVKKNQLDKFV
jgi:hypothetical protein